MIDASRLLEDLTPLLRALQDDLRERSAADQALDRRLHDEWQAAKGKERTAQSFETWREDVLAQAAVMWILGGVFVRFLEDNTLIATPYLAGPGDRLRHARDQRTLFFQREPLASDRWDPLESTCRHASLSIL